MMKLARPHVAAWLVLAGCAHEPPPSPGEVAPAPAPTRAEAPPEGGAGSGAQERIVAPLGTSTRGKCEACLTISPPLIRFALDDASIQPTSALDLDDIAAVLVATPEIPRVRLDCHAGNTERDPQALSELRCEAVKRHLVDHGVAADRLIFHAVGDTRPLYASPPENACVEMRLDTQ